MANLENERNFKKGVDMSLVSEAFVNRMGEPNPTEPLGFSFPLEWDQEMLVDLYNHIGAGHYLKNFIYLLGSNVHQMNYLLGFWSFLFTDNKERHVIGKNAYGCLIVIEESSTKGTTSPIGILDILNVRYFTNPGLYFMALLGSWLPRDELPLFMDNRVYQEFLSFKGNHLKPNEILAIVEPLSLGGKFELGNFQVEPIESYFETVTKIYRNIEGQH